MTVPADPNTVQNAAAGAPLQAALLDAFRDYLLYLSTNKPHCRVYNNANISIANASGGTALTFNSERYDVGATHSTSSNTGRFTVPAGEGGKYTPFASVRFASNATGYRTLQLRLNGTTTIASIVVSANATAVTDLSISTDYALVAGDYIEVVVEQTSGGALNVSVAANLSPEGGFKWWGI